MKCPKCGETTPETEKKNEEALEWLKEWEEHLLCCINDNKTRLECNEKRLKIARHLIGQLEGQSSKNCPID